MTGKLCQSVALGDLEENMKRISIIAVTAAAAVLAITTSASARLGVAPLAVQDDAVIQVRGHGHGHGHMHHHGRGHHYGWRHHRHH